ncbi:MAG: helix-turn-helix transcriptional regulator, partial [Gammaproteobacteria bacterium]|nr:helix-turn-helix transcriptional regulator [Gammaproteobacteria bacterium]
MNVSASTCDPVSSTSSCGLEWLKQNRQLLTLLTEAERAMDHDLEITSTYLNQAIALLTLEGQSEGSQRIHRGGLARWQILRVNEFINEHLDQCIRTAELASLLGLSVSHFSHAFKQKTGITPLMYVSARRVEAAGRYMLCTERPLSEIAISLGFCDQSHFCRVFRRETGLSPQTWRKLHTDVLAEQPASHESNYP